MDRKLWILYITIMGLVLTLIAVVYSVVFSSIEAQLETGKVVLRKQAETIGTKLELRLKGFDEDLAYNLSIGTFEVYDREEIAYEMGYISKEKLLELAEPLKKNQYGQYLINRANQPRRVK